MADIQAKWVTLQAGDGSSMRAYVAGPDGGKARAGMMVFQEAFGVNAHIRDVTERLAREGYQAIAPELYHRTGPGLEGAYGNFEPIKPHMMALTNENLEADVRSTYGWLGQQSGGAAPAISCVGFCMGGRVAFLANSILPLKASVSFYGGGIAPNAMGPGLLDRANSLHAPQLFFWGGLDKHIPADQRQAVTDALNKEGKTFVSVDFSDADHGFFCDARSSYNPAAGQQAWALTRAFLHAYEVT